MAQLQQAKRQQAIQNMPPNLPRDQQYAYLVANKIAPSTMGFTGDEINQYEGSQMYNKWNNQTGGMQNIMDNYAQGGYGKNQNPATGQPMWTGQNHGGQLRMGPAAGGAGQAANPYGGNAGLYGAGGNALRQQLMDSGQFNPNGSNTYAIQNMDLSGQGASVGQQGQAIGGMSAGGVGQVDPNATNPNLTQTNNAVGATPNPYTPASTGGGGNHQVQQGGASGGVSGLGLGTSSGAQLSTAQQYQPGASLATPTNALGNTNTGSNPYSSVGGQGTFGGGGRAHPMGPIVARS